MLKHEALFVARVVKGPVELCGNGGLFSQTAHLQEWDSRKDNRRSRYSRIRLRCEFSQRLRRSSPDCTRGIGNGCLGYPEIPLTPLVCCPAVYTLANPLGARAFQSAARPGSSDFPGPAVAPV